MHIDLAELACAPRLVQASLRHLELSLRFRLYESPYDDNGIPLYTISNKLGSLTDFEKLEHVNIPFIFLLENTPMSRDFERLGGFPQSIRYIRLTDNMADLYEIYNWSARPCLERLEDFLADWKNTTPNLEHLSMHFEENWGRWERHERQEFSNMCKAAGVDCDISDSNEKYRNQEWLNQQLRW